MKRATILTLGVAALLMAAASAAQATDLSSSLNNTGGASFYTNATDFTLPSGFSNASLTITDLQCDDRCVVELNGTVIDAAGIFGPGNGSFTFTTNGTNDPFTFTLGNGARNIDVTSGFLTGTNELLIIVNDTGDGIFGGLTNGPNGTAGPTGYSITAAVTFDAPAGGGVPEPATWAMLLLGVGAIGATLRSRRAGTFATS